MMGAKLVNVAYTYWSHLPDRPFRLLVQMCLVAKDTDENPQYYGKREQMILAIGQRPENATADSMVSQAVRRLLDAGAIARKTNARFGKKAEFWVRVGKTSPQVDSRVKQCFTTESTNSFTQESTQVDSTVKQSFTPQSTQGGIPTTSNEENREEPHLVTNSGVVALADRIAKSRNSSLTSARDRADAELGGA